jgi:bacteriocin-like protein
MELHTLTEEEMAHVAGGQIQDPYAPPPPWWYPHPPGWPAPLTV